VACLALSTGMLYECFSRRTQAELREVRSPAQRLGKCADQCLACFLELATEEEVIPTANAGRFDQPLVLPSLPTV
jgi:hypothetical protein